MRRFAGLSAVVAACALFFAAPASAATAPKNTSLPTISGTPQVGNTLTGNKGTWTGASTYAYQWRRCQPSTCSSISGATKTTYVVQSADVDRSIQLKVTASGTRGRTTSAVSARTATVTNPVTPPPPPPPPPSGTTAYVATNGLDSSSCASVAPCKTFARALLVANDVEVAGGAYASQVISNVTKTGAVVHPASGAAVTIGGLDLSSASGIEVRDMALSGLWVVDGGSTHIILRNLRTLNIANTGTAAFIQGATDLQIIGGEIGYVDPGDGIQIWPGATNSNIVIDGLYMHDLTRNNASDAHDDCMQVANVNGLVIRNSRFENCGTQGLFFNPFNGATVTNVTVQDSTIGKAQLGYNAVYIGDASTLLFQRNTITDGVFVYTGSSGVRFLSNQLLGFGYSGGGYACSVAAQASDVFDSNTTNAPYCDGSTNTTYVK